MGTTGSERPMRAAPYLPVRLVTEVRESGELVLRNANPLFGAMAHMLSPLEHWAKQTPEAVWLAQRHTGRQGEGWAELGYAAGWDYVRSVATGLIDIGIGSDTPVMVLSRNSIEHALVAYAAMATGAFVTPVTPAYSLLSKDHARLRQAMDMIRPGLIFVEDGAAYQTALDALGLPAQFPVVYVRNAPERVKAISLWDLAETLIDDRIAERLASLRPDMPAKVMLTSGSTGSPKAVINTHGMIATNVAMIRSVYDEQAEAAQLGGKPVMVNFLPWSHTLGGNAILHYLTHVGGALYVDWGAPTPDRFAETVRNLCDVAPTHHTTVPAAWAMLATELEQNPRLAGVFFSRLVIMAYGGATMGQDIYERIQAVAVATTGERITLSAGYGATETAPTCSNVHWLNDRMGLIGLPVPGCTLKLSPVGDKRELRAKGPHITPGYLGNPQASAAAFDEEGFFRLGDAVRLADPERPEAGLAFVGRIAEEFKLSSGAWVAAGKVRVDLLTALDGVLSDLVVCGEGQDDIRVLGFLNLAVCQRLAGAPLSLAELGGHLAVRDALAEGLKRYNASHGNQNVRVAALIALPDAPDADAGEITDKGYLNQARLRERRSDAVATLYADIDFSKFGPLIRA